MLLERALPLLRPFAGSMTTAANGANIVAIQVRNNCPWHRSSYKPAYFPFRIHKRLTRHNINHRLETEAGRHILLRRILGEKPFITWNWPAKKPEEKRISNPI